MGELTAGQKAQIQRLQDNLSALRRIAGWTMEELGCKIGVTKQTISNLEGSGKKARMSLTQYLAIRTTLDYEAAVRLSKDKTDTLLALAIQKVLDEDLDEEEIETVEGDVALIAAAVAGKAPEETVTKLAKEKIGSGWAAQMLSAITASSIALNAIPMVGVQTAQLLFSLGLFGWMGALYSAGRIKDADTKDHEMQSSNNAKDQ